METQDVYIIGGLRSHIGLTNGFFSHVRPEELGAALLRAIFTKWPEALEAEELIGGNAVGSGGNLMRLTALMAGMPKTMPALTIDMQCASAAASLAVGYAKIKSGLADLLICGGVESTSMQPLRTYQPGDPRYTPEGYMVAQFSPDTTSPRAMLEGAERTAQHYGLSRHDLDPWAVRSHHLAAASEAIVAPYVVSLFGSHRDEGIRPRMSPALARRMPPLFTQNEVSALLTEEERHSLQEVVPTLTAANACLTHDGAAFVILASKKMLDKWKQEGKKIVPWAKISAAVDIGTDPRYSPLGALRAGDEVLAKAGISYDDLDVIEYNEAFAVISALFIKKHPACLERYLPLGGALAYGHPYGASGAILVLHALAYLCQQNGRYGLTAVAGAGGTGCGILLERVS
jgi:acetyl-CoA C-acetyltransferase